MKDKEVRVGQRVIFCWDNSLTYEVGTVTETYGVASQLRAEVMTDSRRTWRGPVDWVVDATVPDDPSSLVEVSDGEADAA